MKKIADLNDIVGNRYGWLTVLNYSHLDKHGHHNYNCLCAGCDTETKIVRNNLRRGITKRCNNCGAKVRGYKGGQINKDRSGACFGNFSQYS
jgi:predicted SprT family Zn-dependent metalloprotease